MQIPLIRYDTEYDQNLIFWLRFYSKMTEMALRRYNSMKNIVYSLFLLKVYSKKSILETKIFKNINLKSNKTEKLCQYY